MVIPVAGGPGTTPNEANPWRGIETFHHQRVFHTSARTPNEANPWRGIETLRVLVGVVAGTVTPNEANPWRGIETKKFAGKRLS